MKNLNEKINYIKFVFYEELGIVIYKEQIEAALNIYKGNFVEVKTGEGKSIINVIASYLLRDLHKKLYIVTVNDYLAERDYLKYKKIYDRLGLSVSFNSKECKDIVYQSDIIYSSSYELIFDYLKYKSGITDIEVLLDGAIVDEADFVLIDNALTQFTISDVSFYEEVPSEIYRIAKELVKMLDIGIIENNYVGYISTNVDAIVDKANMSTYITEIGINRIENILNIENINLVDGLYSAINDTIKAEYLYLKERDYIVIDNRIVLISRTNSRLMKNSKFDSGIQLAIEIKENVNISNWINANIEMSYQIFYNSFKGLYGLSGTLKDASEEIKNIYNKNIKYIRRHFKNRRVDKKDIIFKTKKEKIEWILNYVSLTQNPLLIICNHDKEAKLVYQNLIKFNSKKIQLLCSYNEEEEKEIISKCGLKNTITVSTFLTARGTDIKIESKDYHLEVISLTRYNNSRIDEQIRGRSARQGEKGSSQFLISLEDDIFNNLFIEDRENFNNLNNSEFFSNKIQKRLSKIISKCQKQNNLNFSYTREKNYILEKIFMRQKDSVEREFLQIDNLKCNLKSFITSELTYIKDNKLKCDFLGEKIDDNTNINIIIDDLNLKFANKLSLLSPTIFNQIVRRILYAAMFNNYNDYKRQTIEYVSLLNTQNTLHNYKFVKHNYELFDIYKKNVYYTFAEYLMSLKLEKV